MDIFPTIAEIAESYGISKNHLMKVAHQLGVAGYVATVRGRSGGLRLAKPAESIGLGEVVRFYLTKALKTPEDRDKVDLLVTRSPNAVDVYFGDGGCTLERATATGSMPTATDAEWVMEPSPAISKISS